MNNSRYSYNPNKYRAQCAGSHDESYKQGYLDALETWAYWKEGLLLVGSCGTKYLDVWGYVMNYNSEESEE